MATPSLLVSLDSDDLAPARAVDAFARRLFLAELFTLYGRANDDSGLAVSASYRDYLAWIDEQDTSVGREAWRRALAGLEEPTLLAPAGAAEPVL